MKYPNEALHDLSCRKGCFEKILDWGIAILLILCGFGFGYIIGMLFDIYYVN